MHTFDPQMTDLVLGYVRNRLAMAEAPLDHPGHAADLAQALSGVITDEGRDASEVLEIYATRLAPHVISADSPRFMSFIPSAPTKAALLFDTVVSCASLQGISWLEAAGAVAAENQVLRVLSDLAGLPASAGGTFVSGGSAGNLSALVVARETARRRLGDPRARLRVAVSGQAHSSIANSLRMLDLEALVIPTLDRRLNEEAVRAAFDVDGHSQDVCAIVATAGTTNAGIIDDLAGVAAAIKGRDIWFHVDAAYGGAGLLAASVRSRYDGIEHADSLVIDPHKWLFAPFDCAALLYREPSLAKAVHTQDAPYLDSIHGDDPDEWNPTDYAYHLTRRARGLPLWFSMAVNGLDAYRDAVEAAIELTRTTVELVHERPYLTLLREPELSNVIFRREGWGADEYGRWSTDLLERQRAFVQPTRWDGELVGRLSFLHPATTVEMVVEVLDAMA